MRSCQRAASGRDELARKALDGNAASLVRLVSELIRIEIARPQVKLPTVRDVLERYSEQGPLPTPALFYFRVQTGAFILNGITLTGIERSRFLGYECSDFYFRLLRRSGGREERRVFLSSDLLQTERLPYPAVLFGSEDTSGLLVDDVQARVRVDGLNVRECSPRLLLFGRQVSRGDTIPSALLGP